MQAKARWVKTASYSAKGMHAGIVVVHRHVRDPQRWRVVVTVDRGGGDVARHVVTPGDTVPLRSLRDVVFAQCRELLTPGELAGASMEFFIRKTA